MDGCCGIGGSPAATACQPGRTEFVTTPLKGTQPLVRQSVMTGPKPLPKLNVEGSNPFARSSVFGVFPLPAPGCQHVRRRNRSTLPKASSASVAGSGIGIRSTAALPLKAERKLSKFTPVMHSSTSIVSP